MRFHRSRPALVAGAIIALVATIVACDGEIPVMPQPELSTYQRIQTQVFDASCVSCHGGATPRGGLRLEPESSYVLLVDATPRRLGAVTDGLKRVMPGDPLKSLLFHKLVGWDAAHHTSDYGNPMPYQRGSLSYGQIEYIRRWIAAGAPREGSVVDTTLLAITRLPVAGEF